MPRETVSVLEIDDRLIQFGCARKTGVEGRVEFARRFVEPPRVLVTPFWQGAWREVGHAETLGVVEADHFRLFSNNAAPDYFVSWLAVGFSRGGRENQNVDFLREGDLLLELGLTPKPAVSITVPFRFRFSAPPAIQVSPFWEGQRSGVGHAETVGRVDGRSMDLLSDNRASNYFVSWLAAGTQHPDRRPSGPWSLMEYPLGDYLLQSYRIPVLRGGVRNFAFAPTGSSWPTFAPFAEPPTVLVTPFWEGQGRGVGHAETLNVVEPHWFCLAAGNGAPNYSVSVLAIGRRG